MNIKSKCENYEKPESYIDLYSLCSKSLAGYYFEKSADMATLRNIFVCYEKKPRPSEGQWISSFLK